MIEDPIDDFHLCLSEYLKKCDIIKTCVFTKHDYHCTSDGEFSSFVKCKVAGNCPKENKDCDTKIIPVCSIVEKELNNLISESRRDKWNLLISKYVLKESRICLHLDRQHTFSVGIETVNKLGKRYGFCTSYKAKLLTVNIWRFPSIEAASQLFSEKRNSSETVSGYYYESMLVWNVLDWSWAVHSRVDVLILSRKVNAWLCVLYKGHALSEYSVFSRGLLCVVGSALNLKLYREDTNINPLQDCFLDDDCSLTQLRTKLAWDILQSLLSAGNENDSNHQETDKNITTLTITTTTSFSKQTVYVGPVMNRQTSAKEAIYTKNMYYRLRKEDMEELGDHKESSEDKIQDLLHAVVSFDLLSTKLDRPVILDFSKGSKASRDLKNRGAPFVLYNYARLNTILHHFEMKQNEKIYPPLPPLGDLYKLLDEEEEWKLMFNFILTWPEVVRNSFHETHPKIHLIYSFLSSLALSFSVYYHRHRVLTEPLPHLLPLVFARIYLLKTVETIFLNAFNILNIKPLPFM